MNTTLLPSLTLPSMRSALRYAPALALLYLILSRTAFHHTRYEDGLFGLGVGTLLGYILAIAFPDVFKPKEPEESDLQTLGLNR